MFVHRLSANAATTVVTGVVAYDAWPLHRLANWCDDWTGTSEDGGRPESSSKRTKLSHRGPRVFRDMTGDHAG